MYPETAATLCTLVDQIIATELLLLYYTKLQKKKLTELDNLLTVYTTENTWFNEMKNFFKYKLQHNGNSLVLSFYDSLR